MHDYTNVKILHGNPGTRENHASKSKKGWLGKQIRPTQTEQLKKENEENDVCPTVEKKRKKNQKG